MYSFVDNTSLYKFAALSNVALSDEILLILFEMLSGNALMILDGKECNRE